MIILTLMIKNEEKIILRCIQSALPVANAILISDTGSTDNTIAVLTEFFSTLSIPTKMVHDPWINFGVNRTNSFQSAVSWANEMEWTGYALVMDADMILHVETEIHLTGNGYTLQQRTPTIEYSNLRFLKLSYPWKCTGTTHEYWDGEIGTLLHGIYIEDKGDGGCKQDKFTRDEKLLKKGLEDEPDNVRYMFYYAQTLRDLGKHKEAIQRYKQRSKAGGWIEEVWYSLYQMTCLYSKLNKIPEMEFWCLKAYELNPRRVENIYVALKTFRERGDYFKAWHYYQLGVNTPKPSDGLFVENNVYTYLFPYEKTILNYYVYPKEDFLYEMVCYLNTYNDHIWSNLPFYISKVRSRHTRPLLYPSLNEYTPSSISVLKMNSTYLLNVRYVNYRLDKGGYYVYPPSIPYTHTRNFSVLTDAHFMPISMTEMLEEVPSKYGVEDIRLYQRGDEVRWFGAIPDYPSIHVSHGVYNIATHTLEHAIQVKSPLNVACEKNWIPFQDKCIYKWNPYTVGHVHDNQFITDFTQDMPLIFNRVSGSSNVVEYQGSLYTMTHIVVGDIPRKYFHIMIQLNAQYRVEAYTLPFYFIQSAVEYCIGIDIIEGVLNAFISQNDTSPTLVEIEMNTFEFISV